MILQGRLLETQGGKANLRKAVTVFGTVLSKSRNSRTQSLARFYLARTHRRLDDHKSAVQTLEPLLKTLRQQGKSSEFHDAWILAGRSYLELKRDKEAISAMTAYLIVQPDGGQALQALATRIRAASRLDRKKQVRDDLDRLAKTAAGIELFAQTLHDVAEAAYVGKDWKWSEELFRRLVDAGRAKRFQAAALSGLGWSQFDQKNYEKSAATFARLVKEFPQDPVLAPQAGYQQGESLELAGKLKEAAVAFSATFKQFAPEKPAAAGSEREGKPHYYTYHAGLAAARSYAKLKETKKADAAYEKLFSRFPQPDGLDLRLDEWALLNYNAGNFKRSDEIFRRLIRDVPGSDLVDNARYSLAESDLNAGKVAEAQKTFAALHADKKSDAVVRELSLYRLIGIGIQRNRWQDVRTFSGKFRGQYTKSEHRWYADFYHAEASLRLNDLVTARRQLQLLQQQKEKSIAGKSEWFPRIWILLAEIALRNRRYKDVEKIVADLRKRRPKFAPPARRDPTFAKNWPVHERRLSGPRGHSPRTTWIRF
ncbi:MAG: tetratricopeptide repeat protein [Planctomycetes bacterium]|nr:tetratricopeptide repeat protein [Planctomycetota bacterium]